VAVKDMRSSEQHEVKRGEVAEFIKHALSTSQDLQDLED
jgi:hypothetical protein